MNTMLSIFNSTQNVDQSIGELVRNGIDTKSMSVVTKDLTVEKVRSTGVVQNVLDSGVKGATTAAVVGGIAGLLVGVGALTVPGIGAILIGGPLAASLGLTGAAAMTVSGAATGALAGGLLGALVGLGLPEETAKIYSDKLNQGYVLFSVDVNESQEQMVKGILQKNNAESIEKISK